MLIEDIMLLCLLGVAVFLIGVPIFRLVRAVLPKKEKNPLVEAKNRLEHARLEVEAAKLNKEAEKLYDDLYQEALEDQENEQHKEKR